MDEKVRSGFQSLIIALLYLMLFIILIPPLMKIMDERMGRVLYGILVAGAVLVAFRLRFLARRLQ